MAIMSLHPLAPARIQSSRTWCRCWWLVLVTFSSSILVLISPVHALSSSSSDVTRAILAQALSSPSGKLTISPELVIPDPSDPTAILLQSNAVSTLSQRIRTSKANAAWIASGATMTAVTTLAREQETARGSFPGPLPLIYAMSTTTPSTSSSAPLDPKALAEAGVAGLTIPVGGGTEITSLEQLIQAQQHDDNNLKNNYWTTDYCQSCLQCGIQPIPEVTVSGSFAATMTENQVEQLVQQLVQDAGIEPVAVLFTMNPLVDDDDTTTNEPTKTTTKDESASSVVPIPAMPKKLSKSIPLLGSVRVTAGENRLGLESQRFQKAGFTGVVLRSDCVPGFRLNPDLDIVGRFWALCLQDLKSTRSKSFQFQSRNNMGKNVSAEWMKYQNNVIESGALGDPNDAYSPVNQAAGEYKGFA